MACLSSRSCSTDTPSHIRSRLDDLAVNRLSRASQRIETRALDDNLVARIQLRPHKRVNRFAYPTKDQNVVLVDC